MKKILTLVCCTILLAATSCTKKYVTPGAKTVFTPANNWQAPDADNPFWTADVSVPDITNYYIDNGAVLVYVDNGNGLFEQLSNVRQGTTLWTTYEVGHVYINYQNANGSSPAQNPGTLKLKIVLVP